MLKNLFTFLSIVTALSLAAINISFAQGFNSISTPDGENIVAAGNNGKLYRSANGGSTYTSYILSGTPDILSVTSFGDDVWMTGENGNVIKTQKTLSPFTTYNVGNSVTYRSVFFVNSNTGFVCGPGGNVYKSVNGGVNWTLSNSGISGNLNSVDFSDANNGTIVADGGSIFITSDGGNTWTSEISGTTNDLLKVKYIGAGRVASGEFGTILTDNGGGWVSVNTRTRSDIKGVTGSALNNVHVCGGGGFIRNNKSGSSNFFNFEENPMMADLVDIFYYDLNNGWAVSSLNSVIIYTTDGGDTWSMPSGSTVSYNWVSKPGASGGFLGNNLCQHPVDRNTFYCVFGGQVSVSRNRGESWSAVGNTIPSTSTPHSFFVSPLDTNIWLVATQSSPDKVYRTTNYGSTWTQVLSQNFSNYGQPLEMDQNNPSVFYFAPDGGGFWKSTNSGETFSEISGNYAFRSPCEILVTWDSSNIIIIGDGTTGSGKGVIFRSINGGVNWTPMDTVSSDGSETPSMCNTVFENNVAWSTEWGGSDIYKSTNYGEDFSLHHNTGFSGWGSDICREDPTMMITGSWGATATISTNGGNNWTNIGTGLSGHGGGILIAERGLILAQQGSNIYKLNITYTDAPVVSSIDVQSLSLGATGVQYYPTTIITPKGTVKNNNGASSATFNVTRKISPGGYVSTKSVINLASSSSVEVNFDQWNFDPGTVYTITDSVYIQDDVNSSNDVLSGTITPYVGEESEKLSETFTGVYPPVDWSFIYTGTLRWSYSSVGGYANGTGSSKFDYWNANTGTNQSLLTSVFPGSTEGDSLVYDYSYAPYTGNNVDSLILEYSTNGGVSYSVLARYKGKNTDTIGVGNSLKTTSNSGSAYTPSSSGQWLTKVIALPVGTNRIKYRARSGFGNNLYIDNIKISSFNLYTLYNIKLAPEGMYNNVTLNLADTVKAYLRKTTSPFLIIDSATSVIDANTLNAPFVFEDAQTGTYYVQIIHRNALETWSKNGGESITKGITANFDFTVSQQQTYLKNSVLVGTKWCLYSGEIIKDGLIDLADLLEVYNSSTDFASGYVVTDLTGEGNVDLADVLIVYNNSTNFVSVKSPESSSPQSVTAKEKARNDLNEYFRKSIELDNSSIREK